MQLFDTHVHLESPRFAADRAEVIARAMEAGVTRILTCGSTLANSREAIALAQAHVGLVAAVGVHAHHAIDIVLGDPGGEAIPQLDEVALAQLAQLTLQPKVVALGELGLDYHYDFSPRGAQRAVLAQQLVMAHELKLPVILHNRESDADLRALVDAAPTPLCGVVHCFLADQAMAAWALAKGFHLGVGGPLTFRTVNHLAPILRQAPLDRLLIETDSPYLAPHPKRGQRNEPAFVVHVAQKLAEVLGLPIEEIARRTTENACRLFGVT
jgi:TatD DNase family protein